MSSKPKAASKATPSPTATPKAKAPRFALDGLVYSHKATLPLPQLVPVAKCRVHPLNVRKEKVAPQDETDLLLSVQALGVLQPVIATEADGKFLVAAGGRRLGAAKAAGLAEIPAIVVPPGELDGVLAAISTAENVARAPMQTVELWQAVRAMADGGMEIQAAARALGLSAREAERLSMLGRIHPAMLDKIRKHGMPRTAELRSIGNASPERQQAIAKTSDRDWRWWDIARACEVDRISQSEALFDISAHPEVPWERDLLSDLDKPEEHFTRDLPAFVAAQVQAVRAWAEPFGERVVVTEWDSGRNCPSVPEGFSASNVYSPRGLPEVEHWGPASCFAVAVAPDGRPAYVVTLRDDADDEGAGHSTTRANADAASEAPKARAAITAKGMEHAASLKRDALVSCLTRLATGGDLGAILCALVASLDAPNVVPGGAGRKHLAALGMSADEPKAVPDDRTVAVAAADAVAGLLSFAHPSNYRSSGKVAEAVAVMLAAQGDLGRFDTPEFLAHCAGPYLRQVAREAGFPYPPDKVADLRRYLVGKLPDWRPVPFGITESPPTPQAAPASDKAEADAA